MDEQLYIIKWRKTTGADKNSGQSTRATMNLEEAKRWCADMKAQLPSYDYWPEAVPS